MPDKIIQATLKLDAGNSNETVKSFKTQLKEANNELLQMQSNFGATSDEALAAARRVAELRDAMGEANEVAGLFDPGAKFQAFGNVLKTVSGGFAAVTGTLALFGEQSADVEKALLKVQAAMAITEGVNTITDSLKDFQRLGAVLKANTVIAAALNFVQTGSVKIQTQQTAATVANTIATEAQTTATVATTAATTGASAAMKVLRATILTTGIGALVVGIIALVVKMQEWNKESESAEDQQKRLAAATDAFTKAVNENIKSIDYDNKLLQLRAKAAGASEEQLAKLTVKGVQDRIDIRAKEISEAIKNHQSFTELSEQQNQDLQELTVLGLQQQIAAREKSDAATKAANDKAAAESKKHNEQLNKLNEQKLADKVAIANAELETDRQKAEKNKAIQDLLNGGEANIDAGALQVETNARIQDEITQNEKSNQDLRIENYNAFMEVLDARQIEGWGKQLTDLQSNYDAEMEIVKGNEEAQMQLTQKYMAAKRDVYLSITSSMLTQAAGLFAKHTAAYKVLAIAGAVIDTYKSAQAAFTSFSSIPIVGVPLGIAAAALAVASGIKNIQAIAKVRVPGAEGGSVPSISASAPAPLQSVPQVGTTTLDQASINGVGNAASGRAFVLESDVTSNQERITRLNRAARLGD